MAAADVMICLYPTRSWMFFAIQISEPSETFPNYNPSQLICEAMSLDKNFAKMTLERR
jgi:hypothetical protein